MNDDLKSGDLVWISCSSMSKVKSKRCWIYALEDLPEPPLKPRQCDEIVNNGLPLVFIRKLSEDEWSDWMWEDDGAPKIDWCFVFYNGKEWVVDPDNISKKKPEINS